MDDETARDMDRLLADGKLSGPEADAILARVFANLDAKQQARRPRVLRYYVGAALAAAAAVLLVVYVPGGGDQGDPVLEVSCASGALSACPASSSLVFRVQHPRAGSYLSAYAEPLDPGGERVFYFSREAGSAELELPPDRKRAAERSAHLSASQHKGRYRVHAFLADRPLGREEMERGAEGEGVIAKARVEVVIVE